MTIFQEIQQGVFYFKKAWQLICQKGLRRFVIIPVLLNVVLLSSLFYVFISQISQQVDSLMQLLPSWLSWLSSLLLFGAISLILLVYYFIFNSLSGFIVAPFNGILSEKVEIMLCGDHQEDTHLLSILKDTPRTLKREWQKLSYSLPRIILLFLLSFMPIVGQSIVPFCIVLFTAWSQTIQYCDYPFDNHKIAFPVMKMRLKQHPYMNLTFGFLVMICTFIPFVNFVIIPVAVCGATAMWVGHYRTQFIEKTR